MNIAAMKLMPWAIKSYESAHLMKPKQTPKAPPLEERKAVEGARPYLL